MATLPAFVRFPPATWRSQIAAIDWTALLQCWTALVDSHLSQSDERFTSVSLHDESIPVFLTTFSAEVALGGIKAVLGSSPAATALARRCFALTSRLLQQSVPPAELTSWEFASDVSRVFGSKKIGDLETRCMSDQARDKLTASLAVLKKLLVRKLDEGIGGDFKMVEERLYQLNYLINASPSTAAFFLAGDDFSNALLTCYQFTKPPLRKILISTVYLCLTGLVKGPSPNFSMLTDQLYSLKAAADAHRAGLLDANDSLVANLVTATPVLQKLEGRLEASETPTERARLVLKGLAAFQKARGMAGPKRRVKAKVDKGKGLVFGHEDDTHVLRASRLSQVQDLFPDLGSGFIAKLLDEFQENIEIVIAHLLDDSLPPHLQSASRTEQLPASPPPSLPNPKALLPTRHNVHDGDPLDLLAVPLSRLHYGKHSRPIPTADALLSAAHRLPGTKAAILSALSALDSDDDERDDTYDQDDVGGSVDYSSAMTAEDETSLSQSRTNTSSIEDYLFTIWTREGPAPFARDAASRRDSRRQRIKADTGWTDEAIEGWAVMLSRDASEQRRLEWRQMGLLAAGGGHSLERTKWTASSEDREGLSNSQTRGEGRGRGNLESRGRGRSVAAPSHEAEAARRRKEANKSSRANHHRRDQRAKKMARGGFAG